MRKWVINCRRDFVPTPCSRLCQDHFEESQFEEIARSPAGGRKLKPNAIPTLFNVPDPPSPITPVIVLPLKSEPVKEEQNLGDHGYARRQPRADLEGSELAGQRPEEEQPCSLCQQYKTQLEKQQQHTARLQREVRLQREAEEMKKKLNKLNKIEKGLQMFLYETRSGP
ncbi:hypothetical protein AAFF_G00304660 [Aldrovandia affinis]|uniref:THAP domain-containing protein 1 n=1 Tax=Aldrovandia affinis TaxID=143900 RepID=A0AAD7SP91_9TELE|nr:hypothetical protein AAFF_G00304660 [Aldrovandia affinis]